MRDFPFSAEGAADAAPVHDGAGAFRVRVLSAGARAGSEDLALREPEDAVLAFEPAGLEAALSSAETPAEGASGSPLATFVFLPSGARTPFDVQRRAEQWMASRPAERGAPFEVAYRSDRILWRRGRALCVGNGEFLRDVRDAVAYFSFCEAELVRLEERVRALWPAVEGDLPLTHAVGRGELRRGPAVDRRTVEAHSLRLRYVRLLTALERLDLALSAPAQRIVSELAVQADTVDRLRLLDDAIEFAQETYDTVNDRLLEYRYFRREYVIEIAIAVILLAELAAVCIEMLPGG